MPKDITFRPPISVNTKPESASSKKEVKPGQLAGRKVTPEITTHSKSPTSKETTKDKTAATAPEKMPKPQKPKLTCKELCHRIKVFFQQLCEKIKQCFEKIFCCPSSVDDDDDDSVSDEMEAIKAQEEEMRKIIHPLDDVKISLLDKYFGKVSHPKIVDPKLKDKKREFVRKKFVENADKMAKEFSPLIKNTEQPMPVKGIRNLGNTCYMNSTIQLIEASYVRHNKNCLQLVDQDLSLKEGETLQQLEERLLKAWAPIPDVAPNLVTKWQKDNEAAQAEIDKKEATRGNTVAETLERNKFLDVIMRNKQALRAKEDGILFKWSFLLLLQAKKYGDRKEIDKAIEFHQDICFGLEANDDFSEGRGEQKDANAYMNLFGDLLNLKNKVISRISMDHKGRWVTKEDPTIDQLPYHSLNLDPGFIKKIEVVRDADKKGKRVALLDLIRHSMTDQVKKELEGKDNPKTFTIDGKQVVSHDYTVEHRFVDNIPETITFHLKRFYTENLRNHKKNSLEVPIGYNAKAKFINFNTLIDPHLVTDIDAEYEVESFNVHQGRSVNGGHYVAYVRDLQGKWFHCSDSSVNAVDDDQVPFEDAYIISFRLARKKPHPKEAAPALAPVIEPPAAG